MSGLLAALSGAFPEGSHADPYPFYAALRRRDGATAVGGGLHLVSRHGDVAAALRDPALERSPPPGQGRDGSPTGERWLESLRERVSDPAARGSVIGLSRLWMINLAESESQPLRAAVGRELSPRRFEELRPKFEALADRLLDAAGESAFDLVAALAEPYPAEWIAELLGVPDDERPRVRLRTRELARFVSGESTFRDAAERAADESAAAAATLDLAELLSALWRAPGGPPPGLLRQLREAGLAEPVAVAQALLLAVAGEETTTNWIGNAVAAWLDAGLAGADWPHDGGGARLALEELVRFESPVQVTFRRSVGANVGRTPVPEGDYVALLLGSANRDERRFEEAGRLRLDRTPNPHLAFGGGGHGCLGATLARLEAEIAVGRLFARHPGLRSAEGGRVRRPGHVLRGYAAYPVLG